MKESVNKKQYKKIWNVPTKIKKTKKNERTDEQKKERKKKKFIEKNLKDKKDGKISVLFLCLLAHKFPWVIFNAEAILVAALFNPQLMEKGLGKSCLSQRY